MRKVARAATRIGYVLIVTSYLLWAGTTFTPAAAQGALITLFTAGTSVVDLAALEARTARIPVSWATVNRPLYANLFFEQVLSDGSVINVELPRAIPWVASSGDGVVAPIPPGGDAKTVKLRVRLVNLLNGQILDERQLELAIGIGSGAGGGNQGRPAITKFMTCCPVVTTDQLAARTARVPVSWATAYRPLTATLVFEQILANGSVVNVELPRSNPWVASSGDGMTAPVPPGGDGKTVRLRVRLINLLNGQVLDVRELLVKAEEPGVAKPSIQRFVAGVASTNWVDLAARSARIPVSWAVENRPANANLFFEQVLPDGRIINVELPRLEPWVASSGDGVVAPVAPVGPPTSDQVVLRLRLVRLSDSVTLDTREVRVPIQPSSEAIWEVVTDLSQCYSGGFPASSGIAVGAWGRVRDVPHPSGLPLYNSPQTPQSQPASLLYPGQVFITLEGPYCYRYLARVTTQTHFRMWKIRLENQQVEGWVQEYRTEQGAVIRYLEAWAASTPAPWFFGTSNDIATSPVYTLSAAYQPFQKGFMVWRGGSREVYGLVTNGPAIRVVERWSGEEIRYSETPPSPLLLPQRGFGWSWVNTPALREALGWALAAEQGYTARFQEGKTPGGAKVICFEAALSGGTKVVRVEEQGGQLSWRFVN